MKIAEWENSPNPISVMVLLIKCEGSTDLWWLINPSTAIHCDQTCVAGPGSDNVSNQRLKIIKQLSSAICSDLETGLQPKRVQESWEIFHAPSSPVITYKSSARIANSLTALLLHTKRVFHFEFISFSNGL